MGPGKTQNDSRDRRGLDYLSMVEEEGHKRRLTVDIVILVILLHDITIPQCHYD